MDWDAIKIISLTVNFIGAVILPIAGFFFTRHATKIGSLEQGLSDLRLKVAEEYVTHSDLSDIKASLIRIEDKLDKKVDK